MEIIKGRLLLHWIISIVLLDSLLIAACLLCTTLNIYMTFKVFLIKWKCLSYITFGCSWLTCWNWCEKLNGESCCLWRFTEHLTNIAVGMASVSIARKAFLMNIRAPNGGKLKNWDGIQNKLEIRTTLVFPFKIRFGFLLGVY